MPPSFARNESVAHEDDEEEDFMDIYEKSGHDIRLDHEMTNIVSRFDDKSTFFERLIGAFEDIRYLMVFSSPIIAHYFLNVTECEIKRKMRQFMKFLAAYWCIILIKSLQFPISSVNSLKCASALMGFLFLLYVYTFRRLSRSKYRFISLILLIGSLSYTLYAFCRQEAFVDGSYAFPFSLVISVIIYLPLDMSLIVPVLIVFCAIFVIISSRQAAYSEIKEDLYINSMQPLLSEEDVYNYFFIIHGAEAWSVFTDNYCMVEVCSWLIVIFIGFYLRFWNDLRQRSAFTIIGKSVRARNHAETSLIHQSDWIAAIMPIQVRDQYIEMMRNNDKSGGDKIWVFSRSFNEVSILFADIVGFTKMSSSKTATRIVMLLNDLYNRFDDLTTRVNCEKIGTLGDCYYAVAGCPVERRDHAMCCVELGLGMCRIIKVFNRDNGEEVNMRVGIHTGRVNAAIIGSNRFRFDVYSTDVIIANEMETYGVPGRVHISHTTFKHVKSLYRFARGPSLPIVKERQVGVGGLEQVEVEMKTYFVDPLSSLLRKQVESYGQKILVSRVLTLQDEVKNDDEKSELEAESVLSGVASTESVNGKEQLLFVNYRDPDHKEREFKRKRGNLRDIHLVQILRDDPKHQVNLFRLAPLTQFFLRFQDTAIERSFKNYMQGYVKIVTIDSPRIAPIIDGIVISLVTLVMLIPYLLQFSGYASEQVSKEVIIYLTALLTSSLISLIFVLGSAMNIAKITPENTIIYRIFATYAFREFMLGILTLIPTGAFVAIMFATDMTVTPNNMKRVIHMEFGMLALLIHCLATSSLSWMRGCCAFLSAATISIGLFSKKSDFDTAFCEPLLWYMKLDVTVEDINERIASALTLTAVIYFITRTNERSIRLWYYVGLEANSACKTAVKENESAQQLLDNVIPPYIFAQLHQRGHKKLKAGTFCFANSVPDVAVSFASLTNFFKSYYREDYQGGESALKLLNTIICAFDDLMKRPAFSSVEKIKTANDCYMIAAGLNQIQRDKQTNKDQHIYELVEFDFALYDTLNEINEKYIIGLDKFEMKIGYYVGDVTAGIIGSRKPIYDIWGNTVNVASRMYSTGAIGQVQTAKEVTERLGDHYNYEYRGKLFVKGKGDMLTYFVHKKGFRSEELGTNDTFSR